MGLSITGLEFSHARLENVKLGKGSYVTVDQAGIRLATMGGLGPAWSTLVQASGYPETQKRENYSDFKIYR